MEDVISFGSELSGEMETSRAYVLLVNGREHNVFVESIGSNYFVGRVALNKTVALVSCQAKGIVEARLVDSVGHESVGPGEDLLLSEECVTPSKTLKIRVRIDQVDIVEDPWRPMLDDKFVTKDGSGREIVDPDSLCLAMPAFKAHYMEGKGFVASPAAWERPVRSNLTLVEPKAESSSDE